MKQYSQMKDSGIEWIGKIPQKWNMKRLKYTTKFELSTVDRHEYDDEIQVSICHYPQVYNNEIILLKTELAKGTCNKKELEKFRLKKDDVLITKDSETPADIGVPAYIQDDFKNAVCGYHLAQLTSEKNQILGSFLFRYIQSDFVNAYFETKANGVTRFGLDKNSINNLRIPIPTISEQKQIANYLDKKTKKLDDEISKNQKLTELLKEKTLATINHAVTKGLEPKVSMKDSGIEWIGKIPGHWTISRLKFESDIRGRVGWKGYKKEDLVDDGALVLGAKHIQNSHLFLEEPNYLSWEKYYESPEIMIKKNDILIVQRGSLGKVTLIEQDIGEATINPSLILLTCLKQNPKFLWYYLQSNLIQILINQISQITAVPMISQENIGNFLILLPKKVEEQKQIADFLDKQTNKIDSLILKVESQIQKLKEFRQSLISSTVTGKIQVAET